jgi:hypothetical protein
VENLAADETKKFFSWRRDANHPPLAFRQVWPGTVLLHGLPQILIDRKKSLAG